MRKRKQVLPESTYLTDYEDVDSLENFHSNKELWNYRKFLLRRSREEKRFIEKIIPKGTKDFFEIGSGNGRLLMALHKNKRNLLGIDVSNSRINFANKWAEDDGLGNITFKVRDVFEMMKQKHWMDMFDVVICNASLFTLFDAIRPSGADKVLRFVRRSLRVGGSFIIHLNFPLEVKALGNGKTWRGWQEFPSPDPWRFCLNDVRRIRSFIVWRKKFIKRNPPITIDEDRCTYIMKIYTGKGLKKKLEKFGFKEISSFSDWAFSPYSETKYEDLIIKAVKER